MLDDHNYNLVSQLVQESKSLKRIRENYKLDSGDCEDCRKFWAKMIDDKEEHVEELKKLVKDHLK